MFTLVTLWFSAFTLGLAQGQQQCHPPAMTSGFVWVTSTKGVLEAAGPYCYDSIGKRLRLSTSDQYVKNYTYPDHLFLFEEGVFYEFNNETNTCKKRPLISKVHPMEIQPNMTYSGEIVLENRNGSDHGVGMTNWAMDVPELDGFLVVSTCNLGCLTLSSMLYTESKEMLFFSFFGVADVKDPHAFDLPEICNGVDLEPKGNTLFGIYLNKEHYTGPQLL